MLREPYTGPLVAVENTLRDDDDRVMVLVVSTAARKVDEPATAAELARRWNAEPVLAARVAELETALRRYQSETGWDGVGEDAEDGTLASAEVALFALLEGEATPCAFDDPAERQGVVAYPGAVDDIQARKAGPGLIWLTCPHCGDGGRYRDIPAGDWVGDFGGRFLCPCGAAFSRAKGLAALEAQS